MASNSAVLTALQALYRFLELSRSSSVTPGFVKSKGYGSYKPEPHSVFARLVAAEWSLDTKDQVAAGCRKGRLCLEALDARVSRTILFLNKA